MLANHFCLSSVTRQLDCNINRADNSNGIIYLPGIIAVVGYFAGIG